MALDSDIPNADSHLRVEFFISDDPDWKGREFVRIMVPGDKLNIVEQPVRDDHKQRFPREYVYFQMQSGAGDSLAIGTPLSQWVAEAPEDITRNQAAELGVLKFQTVEQVATASDAQVQRVGMGAAGLRERARAFLARKNRSESQQELDDTKRQLAQLQDQMQQLLAARTADAPITRGPGRPRKAEE